MKSFDRRSFGKLLLGAIPAVFLAKTVGAEPQPKPNVLGFHIWVVQWYTCGCKLAYKSPGRHDPQGIMFREAQEGRLCTSPAPYDSVYRVADLVPCPDCTQKSRAEAWLNESREIPFNRKEFANTLTQFLEDPRYFG